MLRICYIVEYKDPLTDIKFSSYVLANDEQDFNKINSEYFNNELTILGTGSYKDVNSRPSEKYYRLVSTWTCFGEVQVGLNNLLHYVIFLISQLAISKPDIRRFVRDKGVMHELIHVTASIITEEEFFSSELIENQLLEIEQLLPMFFLTKAEKNHINNKETEDEP